MLYRPHPNNIPSPGDSPDTTKVFSLALPAGPSWQTLDMSAPQFQLLHGKRYALVLTGNSAGASTSPTFFSWASCANAVEPTGVQFEYYSFSQSNNSGSTW